MLDFGDENGNLNFSSFTKIKKTVMKSNSKQQTYRLSKRKPIKLFQYLGVIGEETGRQDDDKMKELLKLLKRLIK